ncbi:MAG: peptide/nickel transport system substrate-binding protein [Pseudonocardiales bacterium]|nr:peptide/nickel transport system substrate-binding protein [Pseudonocardiales bacterium]
MELSTMVATAGQAAEAAAGGAPVRGGSVAWAGQPGFPPATIFPFTPPERIGIRNLFEFQALMYRPLYWLGRNGKPEVDPDLSLAEPPEWSADGRTVTVTLKPWKWSNGEPICADNVMFWVNMMVVKGPRYGKYVPGFFPDNLISYEKIAQDTVRFVFDRAYSRTWVVMNQLSLITPMPKAWDRTADDTAACASTDLADIPAVYDYLVSQNGDWTSEDNELRTRWPSSPVWSVVNGPWRLATFSPDGAVSFVPNEHYSGPNKPYLDEFRQVPVYSEEELYAQLQAGPDGPDGIQVGFLPFGLDASLAEGGANPLQEHYRLVPQDVYCVRYMPMNFANTAAAGQIFRQAYFRQALQSCLDQDSAIRDIFHGFAHRTDGPVPSLRGEPIPVAGPEIAWPFDVERARSLLADNGWDVSTTPAVCLRPGSGPGCAGEGIEAGARLSFSLRYVKGKPALTQLMRQLETDAAKAGIELRLQPIYGSVMVAEDHTEGAAGHGRWELNSWNGGWVFYGHPTGEMLFKTGAGSNWAEYSDPRADELIERTVLSDDPSALAEYHAYLAEQVPAIWTPGFPLRLLEIAKNLRGVEPINPYGMINPENWHYVDDAAADAR